MKQEDQCQQVEDLTALTSSTSLLEEEPIAVSRLAMDLIAADLPFFLVHETSLRK